MPGARAAPAGSRPRRGAIAAVFAAAALAASATAGCGGSDTESGDRFDGDRAFELIETQVAIGPRPAGSQASEKLGRKLRRQLPNAEVQPLAGGLLNLVSVVPGREPAVLVAAHYDTEATVPDHVGANDGAAGTAALVELARTIEAYLPEDHREVRFALFDGEEEPPGCPDARFFRCALRGSKAYAAANAGEIGEVILLDYIANQGLSIPREGNSDPALWAELRGSAEAVGAEELFPDGQQPPIVDDHVPFIQAGIPAIDLIDFSYPYADTAQDTPDKLDPEVLDAVGETVAELIIRRSAAS